MSDNDEREELKSIRKSLKKVLSKSRYEHTLGVEFTSAALAMCYGADIKKLVWQDYCMTVQNRKDLVLTI